MNLFSLTNPKVCIINCRDFSLSLNEMTSVFCEALAISELQATVHFSR